MSTATPELPKRVPGTSLALSLNYDVFAPALPLVVGDPVCFECELEPAVFSLTLVQPTLSGGTLAQSHRVGERCVGRVAAAFPNDVDVLITRLRKDPS